MYDSSLGGLDMDVSTVVFLAVVIVMGIAGFYMLKPEKK
jgi:hypothetical protein